MRVIGWLLTAIIVLAVLPFLLLAGLASLVFHPIQTVSLMSQRKTWQELARVARGPKR